MNMYMFSIFPARSAQGFVQGGAKNVIEGPFSKVLFLQIGRLQHDNKTCTSILNVIPKYIVSITFTMKVAMQKSIFETTYKLTCYLLHLFSTYQVWSVTCIFNEICKIENFLSINIFKFAFYETPKISKYVFVDQYAILSEFPSY